MTVHYVNGFTDSPAADCCGATLALLDASEITLNPDAVTCDQHQATTAAPISGAGMRARTAVVEFRTVQIPGSDEHDGWHRIEVTLIWECPQCGGPRGEVVPAISYDGSRRLACDSWSNPCGHVDTYAVVRREAAGGTS